MRHVQSSRRAAPLRDVDYDHEITLVDHERTAIIVTPPAADRNSTQQPDSPEHASPAQSAPEPASADTNSNANPTCRNISSALLSMAGTGAALGAGAQLPVPSTGSSSKRYVMSVPYGSGASVVAGTQTEIRGVSRQSVEETTRRNSNATPPEMGISSIPSARTAPPELHEWVIDVLYENQRGMFLCSTPFFAAKALGNFDPSPWTNTYHKPSLTSPEETQLPDPSWEWVWSEWRINHDPLTDCDDDGWEYSFAFSNRFSWHGPTWYSSFVRRRAWTRKRCRGWTDRTATAPDTNATREPIINTPFTGHSPMVAYPDSENSESPDHRGRSNNNTLTPPPAHTHTHTHTHSKPSSRSPSVSRRSMAEATRATRTDLGMTHGLGDVEIYDTQQLLSILRAQRIDREKLEAVDNYLRNALDDLQQLQNAIHEIMRLVVFQDSRCQLLARIAAACELTERTLAAMGDGADECGERTHMQKRLEHLQAAKTHAEEEVRRLAYWSDVRVLGNRLGEVE